LYVFYLKFTINANIVYIPVEATISTSIVCPNHYGQYFDNWSIALFIVSWLWSQLSSLTELNAVQIINC